MIELKKAQVNSIRLLLSISILLFGALGIVMWSYGLALSNSLASWIGRIILGLISLLVLVIERFIK